MPGGPPHLFDHVKLPVRDIARSRAFYERAMQPFGVRVVESSQGPGFTIDDREDFWIIEQEMAAASVHIAFAAPDPDCRKQDTDDRRRDSGLLSARGPARG